MNVRDHLPDFSQTAWENEIRAALPVGETDPDLWLCSVGVAGFEPTTSSSRTKRATKLRYTPSLLTIYK